MFELLSMLLLVTPPLPPSPEPPTYLQDRDLVGVWNATWDTLIYKVEFKENKQVIWSNGWKGTWELHKNTLTVKDGDELKTDQFSWKCYLISHGTNKNQTLSGVIEMVTRWGPNMPGSTRGMFLLWKNKHGR